MMQIEELPAMDYEKLVLLIRSKIGCYSLMAREAGVSRGVLQNMVGQNKRRTANPTYRNWRLIFNYSLDVLTTSEIESCVLPDED